MRKVEVSSTHWRSPNRIKVPPSITNPAGNIAFTPHTDRYFPTKGPENDTALIWKPRYVNSQRICAKFAHIYPFILHRIQPKSYFAHKVWYKKKCAKCVDKICVEDVRKLHNKWKYPNYFVFYQIWRERDVWSQRLLQTVQQ